MQKIVKISIVVIAFMLFGFAALTWQPYNFNYKMRRVRADSGLVVPRGDTLTVGYSGIDSVGSLLYKNSNNTFYYLSTTGWKSLSGGSIGHVAPGTVTFTPVASPDTYFGTGYSINISGDGDHFRVTINTGTGISATGTLGNFTIPVGFASTPVTVWSGGTVTTNGTNIGFGINATTATNLIMFNSQQFLPSATYIYNVISGL